MVEQLGVGSRQLAVHSRQSGVGSQQLAVHSRQSAVGSLELGRGDEQSAIGNEQEDAFQFSIFCSNKDLDGTIPDSVVADQWVQYNSNTRVWYSSDDNIIPVLKKEIKLNKPDLFYVIGLYDWNYNYKPLLNFREIPKIISVRGMLHPGALSQKASKKKIYLGAWKMMGWHKKYKFHVSDETEMGYVKEVFGDGIDVVVAGNFPMLHEPAILPIKERGMLKMVSVALISPMKNILVVLETLRQVGSSKLEVGSGQEEGGSSKLLVGSRESGVIGRESGVGSQESGLESLQPTTNYLLQTTNLIEYNIYGPIKDATYWKSCLEVIKKMPENVIVKYHGEIPPAEIGKILSQHHVFILPSKSENYGHSIVEALSAGLPVITSDATPWNGLEKAKAGMNVNPEYVGDLRRAIDLFVGMGEEELMEWSKGAREYVLGRVDVEKTVKEYEGMFGM